MHLCLTNRVATDYRRYDLTESYRKLEATPKRFPNNNNDVNQLTSETGNRLS